jgi:hypothetical protein
MLLSSVSFYRFCRRCGHTILDWIQHDCFNKSKHPRKPSFISIYNYGSNCKNFEASASKISDYKSNEKARGKK